MFNQKLLNPVVRHEDHNRACMDTWSALEKELDNEGFVPSDVSLKYGWPDNRVYRVDLNGEDYDTAEGTPD